MCVCGDNPSSPNKKWALIPARDEQNHIAALVSALHKLGFSVLVVDDGSKDATAEEAEKAGASLLRLPPSGKGSALSSGLAFLSSLTDRVVILDADGQHSPLDALRLYRFLQNGYGLVVGNRLKNPSSMPPIRRLTNRAMSAAIRLIAKKTVPDSQCGLKAINLRSLRPHLLKCKKFDWETEVILQAIRMRIKVASIPIKCIYRGTKSRISPFGDAIRFLWLLLRYLLGVRMGVHFLWQSQ